MNRHHRFVRQKVDEIRIYAEKVARVHGSRDPETVDIARKFDILGAEMLQHLGDEEEIVFPLITEIFEARMSAKTVDPEKMKRLRKELDRMIDDHDGAGTLMEEIRELSHRFTPPEGACTTYRILYENLKAFEEDLHKHVHLENNILFKKAEALI